MGANCTADHSSDNHEYGDEPQRQYDQQAEYGQDPNYDQGHPQYEQQGEYANQGYDGNNMQQPQYDQNAVAADGDQQAVGGVYGAGYGQPAEVGMRESTQLGSQAVDPNAPVQQVGSISGQPQAYGAAQPHQIKGATSTASSVWEYDQFNTYVNDTTNLVKESGWVAKNTTTSQIPIMGQVPIEAVGDYGQEVFTADPYGQVAPTDAYGQVAPIVQPMQPTMYDSGVLQQPMPIQTIQASYGGAVIADSSGMVGQEHVMSQEEYLAATGQNVSGYGQSVY